MRGCGNRGAAGSYLKQNYEMLAERARADGGVPCTVPDLRERFDRYAVASSRRGSRKSILSSPPSRGTTLRGDPARASNTLRRSSGAMRSARRRSRDRETSARASSSRVGRPASSPAAASTVFFVDRVVDRLERQPGQHGGLGRGEKGIVRLHDVT
jgi:hypothetical protein